MLMSWAFSVMQLRSQYSSLELVTDRRGRELLIDSLKLPYTSVVEALNDVDHYDRRLWAIGKLYTYQLQREPFLHIDGDIFIWKKFTKTLEQGELIALHPHDRSPDHAYCNHMMSIVNRDFNYVPNFMSDPVPPSGTASINAGIFGGRDIDFFQQYTQQAFKFVDLNKQLLCGAHADRFNTVFEQLLFFRMLEDKTKITYYLDRDDPSLYSFAAKGALIHARSDKRIELQFLRRVLSYHLRKDYPESFANIQKTISDLAQNHSGEQHLREKENSHYDLDVNIGHGQRFLSSEGRKIRTCQLKINAGINFMLPANIPRIKASQLKNSTNEEFQLLLRNYSQGITLELSSQGAEKLLIALDLVRYLVLEQFVEPATADNGVQAVLQFVEGQSTITRVSLMQMLQFNDFNELCEEAEEIMRGFIEDCVHLGILNVEGGEAIDSSLLSRTSAIDATSRAR